MALENRKLWKVWVCGCQSTIGYQGIRASLEIPKQLHALSTNVRMLLYWAKDNV